MQQHLKAPVLAGAVLVAAAAVGIVYITALYQQQRETDTSAAEGLRGMAATQVVSLLGLMTTGFSGAWPRARLRTQC